MSGNIFKLSIGQGLGHPISNSSGGKNDSQASEVSEHICIGKLFFVTSGYYRASPRHAAGVTRTE
jgi:hypothetical protein